MPVDPASAFVGPAAFARKLLLAAAGMAAVAGPVLAGILNVPQRSTQAKAERLTFEVASVKSPDPNAGGDAPAGVPGARGGGGWFPASTQIGQPVRNAVVHN